MRTAILLCCIALACQCFGGQLYQNNDLGFSFELPDDWNFIPFGEFSEDAQEMLNRLYDSRTIGVYQKGDGKFFSYPCIQINYKRLQNMTDSESYRDLFSEEGKNRLLKSAGYLAEFLMKYKTNDFKLLESERIKVPKKNAVYGFNKYQHKDGRELIAVVIKLSGPRKIVTLRCFERGANTSSFLPIVDSLIDSFVYESNANIDNIPANESPALQKNMEDSDEINRDLLAKIYFWLPSGVFIIALIIILRRWASG